MTTLQRAHEDRPAIRDTPGEAKRRELKRRAIEGLRQHGTLTAAAASAGVAVLTVYRWRERDEAFNAAVIEFLHVDMIEELHASMYRIATSEDPKMATAAVKAGEFLLKAHDRDTFGDKLQVDSRAELSVNVQLTTDLQIRRRAAIAELERLNVPSVDAEFRVLEDTEPFRHTEPGHPEA